MGSAPSDAELERLLIASLPQIRSLASKNRRLFANQQDTSVDDLAQEIAAVAWKRRHSYDPSKAKFATWVVMQGQSKIKDECRADKRRVVLHSETQDELANNVEEGQLVPNSAPLRIVRIFRFRWRIKWQLPRWNQRKVMAS